MYTKNKNKTYTIPLTALLVVGLALLYITLPVSAQSNGLPPMSPNNTLYTAIITTVPLTGNSSFNPNVFANTWSHQYGLNYAYLTLYNASSGGWIPDLAQNWTMQYITNGSLAGWAKITIYLRNSGWSNGQPYTCYDIYAQNIIQSLFYDALGNVTIVNNSTCILWIPPDAVVLNNSTSLNYGVMTYYYPSDGGLGMFINYQMYKPLVDNLTKYWNILYAANFNYGTTQEQNNGSSFIKVEFQKFKSYIPSFTFPPPQNGPFYVVDITPSEIILAKNPYYWDANNIKVDYVVIYQYSSTSQLYPALETGQLSFYIGNLPPSIAAKVEQNPNMNFTLTAGAPGDTLYFNFLWPYINYTQVRQAIIYAINMTEAAAIAGPPYEPPTPYNAIVYPTVNPHEYQRMIQYWESQGYPLIYYSYNTTKAAQLLESVGFTRKNGIWYTPSGTPFTLTILANSGTASNPQLIAMLSNIETQLDSFGISTSINILPSSEFPAAWTLQKNNYALGYNYGPPGFSIIIPDLFPVNGYFEGNPINVTHWNGLVTLPNGTARYLFSQPNICPTAVTVPQILDCVFTWGWEANHNPWFISIDTPYIEIWYNTKYFSFPPSTSWVWDESPGIEIGGPTYWSLLVSAQPVSVTPVTTTPPITSTKVSVTPVTTTPPITSTKLPPPTSLSTTTIIIVIVVVVIVIIALAVLLSRRRH